MSSRVKVGGVPIAKPGDGSTTLLVKKSSATVGPRIDTVLCDYADNIALTLTEIPELKTRSVRVVDRSGKASTFPITIQRGGSTDVFANGATSIQIDTNGGIVDLEPDTADRVWLVDYADLTGEASGGITASQHKVLRQLIHFIDDGPAGGFASGAYREVTNPGVKPTAFTWYDDATKAKKIVELTITYTGINPTTEVWKVYDTDGSTVLATVTDLINYSGVFETNRTRTIA